jgi:ferredoxin
VKVIVDRTRCTGLGMCEALAPDVFEVDPDGNLNLLADDLPSNRSGELEAAVSACPTEALSLITS